jgi:hypothetical protein
VLQDGEWTPCIDWTFSPVIEPSETNTLTVIGRGAHFSFYINGSHVGDLTDTQFSTGKVGLVVGFDGEATGHYAFDNFKLYQPETTDELHTSTPTSTPYVDPLFDALPRTRQNVLERTQSGL